MNIVITMAGAGQRFIDAGYNIPKYMIKVKGKTLFEWSMLSLKQLNNYSPKYGFIPCFVAEGDYWSFVKVDKNNKAIEVKENYFKTAGLYKELYSQFYKSDDNLVNGKKYIAPLYNLQIKTKGDVYITTIDNRWNRGRN